MHSIVMLPDLSAPEIRVGSKRGTSDPLTAWVVMWGKYGEESKVEGGRECLRATLMTSLLLPGRCSPWSSYRHGVGMTCVGWLAGHRLTTHSRPRTLLKLSFSYFLHPSNSLDKEENKVSADNPHLRPMTG